MNIKTARSFFVRRFGSASRVLASALIRQKDVWFEGELDGSGSDILFVHHALSPIGRPESVSFKTILIDLTLDQEVLWNEIKKDTRKNIRRAERDGVCVTFIRECTAKQLEAFGEAYRDLEHRKGLPLLNRNRLKKLNDDGLLILSTAEKSDGQTLSWHTHIAKGSRVRALNSVSLLSNLANSEERSFAGRANRLHVWRDIQYLKQAGFSLYDNGGYYDGDDPIRRSISVYKEEFGGRIFPCYSAIIPVTWRGRLALRLRKMLSS